MSTCFNCKHFMPTSESMEVGECRRNPPVPTMDIECFPVVLQPVIYQPQLYFCGEFSNDNFGVEVVELPTNQSMENATHDCY